MSFDQTDLSPEKDPFRALVFTADLWEHVCPTIRITAPADQSGVRVIRGNAWENGNLVVYPERVAEADLIIVQRNFPEHIQAYEEIMALARAQGKFVVYELDDLLSELPEEHPDYYHYLSGRATIIRALVEADGVVVSTQALCDYVKSYNPNSRVFQNYLIDQSWSFCTPLNGDNDPLTIGYLGGHSHSYDLEIVAEPLLHILEKYPKRIMLKFWGVPPPLILQGHPQVDWVNLGILDYTEFAAHFAMQRCDIFIAPLKDNLFNRCKSHLKFLEYSAMGVPGVYSRISTYEDVVVHGENGFLATTSGDWEKSLTQLIENPDLRFQIGKQAQATVRVNWMLSDHSEEWKQIYKQFADQHSRPPKSAIELQVARKLSGWQQDLTRDLARQISSLRQQVAEKDRVILEVNEMASLIKQQNREILNSRSWRFVEKFIRLRLKLVPHGSRTEQILKWTLHAPRALLKEGIGPFLRSTRQGFQKLKQASPGKLPSQNSLTLPVLTPQTAQCTIPSISIVVLKNHLVPEVEILEVTHWLGEQTLPTAANIVIWDRNSGLAWLSQETGFQWDAPDLRSFISKLSTRYICIACSDLVKQDFTYLETNLMALEAEALAFTINLCGHPNWALKEIQRGFLPGDAAKPLFRQIVNKEFIHDDFTLDLSQWIHRRQKTPGVAGKVVFHTTNHQDVDGAFPFKLRLQPGENLLLNNSRILVRPDSELSWNLTVQSLNPIDQAIPVLPDDSDIPTIIMVHPFLAVGGAEQISLKAMQNLKNQIRWVVVTFEELDSALGTTADAFRQVTPFVYNLPDFLHPGSYLSFMKYLIERLQPTTLYIANGTPWIYDALSEIKSFSPGLRIANQVYDSVIGWINRYDTSLLLFIEAHVAPNSKILQAYINKGVKPEQTYLFENGIDPDEINPKDYPGDRIAAIKEKLGLAQDKKVVTFASRLHPQKRPMDFVELARRFSFDPTVAFLMVGDGPLAATVDEQIDKIGLKNVSRHMFYRPISEILAVTDVLVLPSDFEGMPMIITEALAMGKPFVATDVGNNREVAERTHAGVIVSQIGDVNGLMNGVRQFLKTPPDPVTLRQVALSQWDFTITSRHLRDALLGNPHA